MTGEQAGKNGRPIIVDDSKTEAPELDKKPFFVV
jgi:hypothetical protein